MTTKKNELEGELAGLAGKYRLHNDPDEQKKIIDEYQRKLDKWLNEDPTEFLDLDSELPDEHMPERYKKQLLGN